LAEDWGFMLQMVRKVQQRVNDYRAIVMHVLRISGLNTTKAASQTFSLPVAGVKRVCCIQLDMNIPGSFI
jgi:hypothetical protein